MVKKQTAIRIEIEILEQIDKIAEDQTKKLGFTVTKSDIINKALKEFCDDYFKK